MKLLNGLPTENGIVNRTAIYIPGHIPILLVARNDRDQPEYRVPSTEYRLQCRDALPVHGRRHEPVHAPIDVL